MPDTCKKCGGFLKDDGENYKLENGDIYHGSCLVCIRCNTQLQGYPFYTADDMFYCQKDYILKFGKKCAKCSRMINEGGISIQGQDFHPDCFKCTHCSNVIAPGQSIIYKLGAPHCVGCGDLACGGCDSIITTDYLIALEKKWHQTCFKCTECDCPLGTNKYAVFQDKPFCEKDIAKVQVAHHDPATECSCCRSTIGSSDAIKAMDKNYHSNCFKCSVCGMLLGNSFYEKDGSMFCEKDYKNKFADSCKSCGSHISGSYFKLESGESYHPECVQCTTCQNPFKAGDKLFFKNSKPFCEVHSCS